MPLQGRVVSYEPFTPRTPVASALPDLNAGLVGLVHSLPDALATVAAHERSVQGLQVLDAGWPQVSVSAGVYVNDVGQAFQFDACVLTLPTTANSTHFVYIDINYRVAVATTTLPTTARYVLGKVVVNAGSTAFASVETATKSESFTYDANGTVTAVTESLFGQTIRTTTMSYVGGTRQLAQTVETVGPLVVTRDYSYPPESAPFPVIKTTRRFRVPFTFSRVSWEYQQYGNGGVADNIPLVETVAGERGLLLQQGYQGFTVAEVALTPAVGVDGATLVITPGQPDPFGGTEAIRIQTSGGTSLSKLLMEAAPVGAANGNQQQYSVYAKQTTPGGPGARIGFLQGATDLVVTDEWTKLNRFAPLTVGARGFAVDAVEAGADIDITVFRLHDAARSYAWRPISVGAWGQVARPWVSIPDSRAVMNPRAGAIVCRVHVNEFKRWAYNVAANQCLWSFGRHNVAGPIGFYLAFLPTSLNVNGSPGHMFTVYTCNDAGAYDVTRFNHKRTALVEGWHNVALRWEVNEAGTEMRVAFWLDGVKAGSTSDSTVTSVAPNPTVPGVHTKFSDAAANPANSAFNVGNAYVATGSYQWLGYQQSYLFFNHAPSDEEMVEFSAPGPLKNCPQAAYLWDLTR